MKKLLVIGGSGSLGNGFLDAYNDKYEIIATYNASKIQSRNVKSMHLDIADSSSFDNLPSNIDAVVLFAAAMPAEMKGYDRQRYIDVNITGTLNTLEYCRKNSIKKIIYIMTFSDVAGAFYTGIPIKETDCRTLTYTGDHSIYAVTKVAACELLEHYHQEYGIQTIIFRIPTVYCYDNKVNFHVDGKERPKAYVQMIRSIVKNNRIELWGDVSNSKDMPYIKDFVRLIDSAIKHPTAQGLFNAGTGSPVSLEAMVDAMIKVFSQNSLLVEKIYRPEMNSQPNFTFDMTKTINTFNFEPEFSVTKMFADIKKSCDINVLLGD